MKFILSLLVLVSTQSIAALPPQYERIREINACVETYATKVMNYKKAALVPVSSINILKDDQVLFTSDTTACLFSVRSVPSNMVGPGKLVAVVIECGTVRGDLEHVAYSKVLKLMENAAKRGRIVKSVNVDKKNIVELKFQ